MVIPLLACVVVVVVNPSTRVFVVVVVGILPSARCDVVVVARVQLDIDILARAGVATRTASRIRINSSIRLYSSLAIEDVCRLFFCDFFFVSSPRPRSRATNETTPVRSFVRSFVRSRASRRGRAYRYRYRPIDRSIDTAFACVCFHSIHTVRRAVTGGRRSSVALCSALLCSALTDEELNE